MTNIFAPGKASMKGYLFTIAVEALEAQGWNVERAPGGKSSVRRITKDGESKLVSIRTTQDQFIAFQRALGDKGWKTLDEVDAVVPVSVDDPANPRAAHVHLIDVKEMQSRFDRAYKARKAAGHSIPAGRGVWVSLYLPEASDPPSHVGAGAGLKFKPFATVPLPDYVIEAGHDDRDEDAQPAAAKGDDEAPLSIADAKRRLAKTFGVDPDNIKITVEA